MIRSKLNLSKLKGVVPKKYKPFVEEDSAISDERTNNMMLLETARHDWESLRDFRDRRKRARNYLRGRQWSDLIKSPDTGKMITEEEYIQSQGKVALRQNQIRQLMNNRLGQFRQNVTKPIVLSRQQGKGKETEMMSNALEYIHQFNQTQELDARLHEEFGISGAIPQKLTYRFIKERDIEDIWIENKNPAMMFFNTDIQDIRMTDLRRIGELIDITLPELIGAFARNKKDEARIRSFYTDRSAEYFWQTTGLSSYNVDSLDFYFPRDNFKCRVVEVWQLQSGWRTYAHDYADGSMSIIPETLNEVKEINRKRIEEGLAEGIPWENIPQIDAQMKYEQFWWYKFLTPWGDLLAEGETPYEHQEHPYAFRAYPMLDGEVWGWIEDVIDQQRYINRLIILQDFIIGSGAKGVLMVPEQIMEGSDLNKQEWVDEWTKFNGVIFYKAKPGMDKPYQVTANSTNAGAFELLQLQMQLLQEISGVSSAIQGMEAKAGTPASLYAQQAQNSAVNSTDSMLFFNNFQQIRDYKVLKLIKQFYKEDRYMAIAGSEYTEDAKLFQPEKVENMQFDILISQAKDTPAYKSLIEDTLKELLTQQLIDLDMYLENSSLPFADRLRESLKNRNDAMAEQQGAGMPGMPTIPGDIQSQIDEGTDPKAMKMLQQAARIKQ